MAAPAPCCICELPFSRDAPVHIPRILPCGHTFCTHCCNQFIHYTLKCPQGCASRIVAPFPINFALLDYLAPVAKSASLAPFRVLPVLPSDLRKKNPEAVFDVRDPEGKWYQAQIIDTKNILSDAGLILEIVKVHYLNWNSRYDEWIWVQPFTLKERFAPAFTHTAGPHQTRSMRLAVLPPPTSS